VQSGNFTLTPLRFTLVLPMIKFIDEIEFSNKRVLLRVDFNVSLNPDYSIADDARIKQALPTINYLLKHHNKIILVSHLGRPHGREEKYSLNKVAKDLERYFSRDKIALIDNFLSHPNHITMQLSNHDIVMLENIRFHPGETENDPVFAKDLASLADVYVNDAFSVDHRAAASVVGVTKYLPSYGGLLLKKEIAMLDKVIKQPKKPTKEEIQ